MHMYNCKKKRLIYFIIHFNKLYVFGLILLFYGYDVNAQKIIEESRKDVNSLENFVCGSNTAVLPLNSINSQEYERNYRNYIHKKSFSNTIHTLPVVVHVFHSGESLGSQNNPTENYISNQITISSDRFRHQHNGARNYTNPHYGVDTEIELCLASVDPNGEYTNGINRFYNPELAVEAFRRDPETGALLEIKTGLNEVLWDPNKYHNIIIAQDIGGSAGIAFPNFTIYKGSSFWSGIICHEVGHYLSLFHTFVSCENNDCLNDGDKVCDTPAKSRSGMEGHVDCAGLNDCVTDENDLSANNPYRSRSSGGMGEQEDMLSNYMDYTGPCWDAFTEGQKQRMKFNLANRQALTSNSIACASISPIKLDAGIGQFEIVQACENKLNIFSNILNNGEAIIENFNFQIQSEDGIQIASRLITERIIPNETKRINFSFDYNFKIGEHLIVLQIDSVNNSTDGFSENSLMYYKLNIDQSFYGKEPSVNCTPDASILGEAGTVYFRLNETGKDDFIIDNESSSSSVAGIYENFFCDKSYQLKENTEYDIGAEVGLFSMSQPIYEGISVYIDYNSDNKFEESERVAFSENNWIGFVKPNSAPNLRFRTPSSTLKGQVVRLRLVVDNHFNRSACLVPSTGQVEDYAVYFGELSFCQDEEIPYNGIDDDCDFVTLDDDLDLDGFLSANDCDDLNANLNPSVEEIPYNGLDDDCSSLTPDDDLDKDGFGFADDCDDLNPNINPSIQEIPNNEIDDDCDPLTPDDLIESEENSEDDGLSGSIDQALILFPFLKNLDINKNCEAGQITEYEQDGFSFIYVSIGENAQLYLDDGTFYCQDSESTNCRVLYSLNNDLITNNWSCQTTEIDDTVSDEEASNQDNTSQLEIAALKFPWLINLNLNTMCEVLEYSRGAFSYIYVITEETATLYFDDGTFYCETSELFDCRELYKLTDDLIVNAWNCTEDESGINNDDSILFEKYNWLEDIIDPACNSGSVIEYQSGVFTYLFIMNDLGQVLYFQDGTKYCTQSDNYDCIDAYALTDVIDQFSCNEDQLYHSQTRELEVKPLDLVRIYPNPGQGIYYIEFQEIPEILSVFSSDGKLILKENLISTHSSSINISEQRAGVYFIKLIYKNRLMTKRIIKI